MPVYVSFNYAFKLPETLCCSI